MVDRIEWRANLKRGLQHLLENRHLSKKDFINELGRPSNSSADDDERPTKQAIYKWFKTGAVADRHLPRLAEFTRSDLDQLRLRGEFRPPRPKPSPDDDGTLFAIYSNAMMLPKEAQIAVLGVINAMRQMAAFPHEVRQETAQGQSTTS
jgi:hypothetical protein